MITATPSAAHEPDGAETVRPSLSRPRRYLMAAGKPRYFLGFSEAAVNRVYYQHGEWWVDCGRGAGRTVVPRFKVDLRPTHRAHWVTMADVPDPLPTVRIKSPKAAKRPR